MSVLDLRNKRYGESLPGCESKFLRRTTQPALDGDMRPASIGSASTNSTVLLATPPAPPMPPLSVGEKSDDGSLPSLSSPSAPPMPFAEDVAIISDDDATCLAIGEERHEDGGGPEWAHLKVLMVEANSLTFSMERQLFELRSLVSTVETDVLRSLLTELHTCMSSEAVTAEHLKLKIGALQAKSEELFNRTRERTAADLPTRDGLCKAISAEEMAKTYGNGYAMLEKMGFLGQSTVGSSRSLGCGRMRQGIATPVHVGMRQNWQKFGIGSQVTSDSHRSLEEDEEEEEEEVGDATSRPDQLKLGVFVRGGVINTRQSHPILQSKINMSSTIETDMQPPIVAGLPSLATLRRTWREQKTNT